MAKRETAPKFTPTDKDRDLVAVLISCGISVRAAAKFVIHPETNEPVGEMVLHRYFKDEIEQARELANARLVQTAFKIANESNNPTMTIFLLKTRLGWKEPAQDVNLHQTYGELVEAATKSKASLVALPGGKA